jgi:hypothetical protein
MQIASQWINDSVIMCHKIIANKNVNTFQDTDPPLDIVQTIL